MVEIGGRPMIWHIMKYYAFFGVKEFIICCGYKGYIIKEYFANYLMHSADVSIDLSSNKISVHQNNNDHWTIHLIDTGENSLTGGRLRRVRNFLDEDVPFFFTYGDGLSNIDLLKLKEAHSKSDGTVTVSAVRPPGRFGSLEIQGDKVIEFREKAETANFWINGGFFVVDYSALDFISGDADSWESDCLPRICDNGGLYCYKHLGFWQPMDTLREKKLLDSMWEEDRAPWKIWL